MKSSTISRGFPPRAYMSGCGLSGASRLAARALLPFILLSFLIASSALASTFTFGTGQGLTPGQQDSNWTVTGVPGFSSYSAYVLGSYSSPGYFTNWGGGAWWNSGGSVVNAKWIGASNYSAGGVPPAGYSGPILPKDTPYTFTTTFNLSGLNLSTVTVSGYWAIDDSGTLSVNGHQIASQSYGFYGSPTTFTIPTADLLGGVNTLTINMGSDDDALNDGTILYATVTGSSVPAPAALLLFGPGFAALVLVRKRLKK